MLFRGYGPAGEVGISSFRATLHGITLAKEVSPVFCKCLLRVLHNTMQLTQLKGSAGLSRSSLGTGMASAN